jgi:Aromatic acid exporter family member 2
MASGKVPEDIGNPTVLAFLTLYWVGSFAYCFDHSEIAYLLSHLMSVLQHLEPAWTRAFLRRTRFLDPDFQGDVLAVISKGTPNSFVCTLADLRYFYLGMISTALRTGAPLPQITPCPLLDRFILYHHGLNVIRHDDDDDYGLPRTMSMDILKNEQYMSVLYL